MKGYIIISLMEEFHKIKYMSDADWLHYYSLMYIPYHAA